MFKKKKKEAEETESTEYSDEAMDQIMYEVGNEESEEGGSKPRSKNTKIALISVIGLVLISGIYFGSQYYDALLIQKDKLMVLAGLKKEEPKISEAEKKVSEEEKAKLAEMERIKKEERMARRKKEAEEGGTKEENVAKEVQPESAEPAKAPPPPAAKAVEHIENQGKQKQPEAPKENLAKKEAEEIHKNKESGKPAIPEPVKAAGNSVNAEKRPPASPIPAAPASPSGGYAIQVGTFAVKENAVSLIQKLSEKGFESFGVPVYGSAGSNAVYAGPFYSRAEAEDAAREIKRAGVHGARVIYDKAEAIYKVDAGKYSSASKADDTEETISSLGFEAISETEKNSGNLTAVYIGNFATEAQAEEVRKGLPKDIAPSSAVVKTPKRG